MDAETGDAIQHMPGSFTVADLRADNRFMVTGSRQGLVEVWDFRSFRDSGASILIEQIPLGSALDEVQGVRFQGNDKVWVATNDGRVQLYTLDSDELLSIARERLTRSCTADECEIYAIDPCPTLDDIRTGS